MRDDIVFVTGRFRSGSTLLWNIFRHMRSFTAYYEPFNERRWFDPATRGSDTDKTHLDVENYWREYDGLTSLSQYFDVNWKFRHLYMNAESWDANMLLYVETMISRAPTRPLLQFNEVDFRLQWLRAYFPRARLLHVYRHPRDQWCSTLGAFSGDMRRMTIESFRAMDNFYLLSWGEDLRNYFPFLTLGEDAHPYELFYQLWRLSYGFGRLHAHLSIGYENLVNDPQGIIGAVLAAVDEKDADLHALSQLVKPLPLNKWKSLAPEEFFRDIEDKVEANLSAFLSAINVSDPDAHVSNGTPRSGDKESSSPARAQYDRKTF